MLFIWLILDPNEYSYSVIFTAKPELILPQKTEVSS